MTPHAPLDPIVLFGATGDLAGRYLLPALGTLHAAGRLPDPFTVIGAAREELDDESFRELVAERLDQHGADMPGASRDAVLRSLHYRPVDLVDPDSVVDLVRSSAGGEQPFVAYLALPPGLFHPTITGLHASGPARGSRIVVEKPFGRDAAEAAALNALLAQSPPEVGAYRVDHALGMGAVQDLVTLRLTDPVLSSLWDDSHIEQVEVLWEETIALEGRASFYDGAGALQDVVQNHVLQVLSLATMEPPTGTDPSVVADRQIDVLRAVRPISGEDVAARTRRARYTAGKLVASGGASGDTVPAYADEDGVDADRNTETFAEVHLGIDTPRWRRTRFVLRAGKALRERRKGVRIQFRALPQAGERADPGPTSTLWISVDELEEWSLELVGGAAGPAREQRRLTLVGPPPPALPPYANVLHDILTGGDRFAVRGDVAEHTWRLIDPIAEAWREGRTPLEEYPAGSAGPARR